MSGWLHHLALSARARTGFSTHIVVWATIAAVSSAAMFVFLCVAAFVWLADRYGAVTAGLVMAGCFFVITLIAVVSVVISRRRTIERARIELAARGSASWLDPRLLGVGVQVGQAIGWRKLASLAAIAILAAGVSKEWFSRSDKPAPGEDERAED
jgi:hypothetical protein